MTAICGGLAVAVWGYYLQSRAFDSLYFIWGDWNQYVEHYQHLLSGKANFAQWCAGDVIILDLHDTGIEGSSGIESFRRRIAADKRVVPVTYCVWENHTIVMFKVFPQAVALPGMPFIGNMSAVEFAKFGAEFPIQHKELSMRGFYHNGSNIYRVRINQILDRDIDINLKLDYSGSAKEVVIRFGNGIVPAFTAPVGTVFEFAVPGDRPEQQAVNICFI